MKMNWKKNGLGYLAIALVCIMIGCAAGTAFTARAEDATLTANTTTTVVTSPFTDAVAKVRSSVVGVSNYQNVTYSNYSNGWGYGWGNSRGDNSTTTQEVKASTGSGVVIAQNYVLTNYHVVADAVKITVDTETDSYDATLAAYDENVDVAVVYVPNLPLAAVEVGDSDTLQVGDWAICIGNPISDTFNGTVTAGIISGLNREISSASTDQYGLRTVNTNTMIQTDAAINNGNSGGGMFNTAGQLMGIPTLKYSGTAYTSANIEGVGMCIPINAAKTVISEALANKDAVTTVEASANSSTDSTASSGNAAGGILTGKPRLGITGASIVSTSTAVSSGKLPNGVYVQSVDSNGPAASAGMQAADIIVDVDDTVITSMSQLQTILADHAEGDTLTVKVYRVEGLASIENVSDIPEGQYITMNITLQIVDAVAQ